MIATRRNRALAVRERDRLRLFPSAWHKTLLVALVIVFIATPLQLDDSWLEVLARCGVAAIGALGLNLLTGYTGQASLGHAAFLGVGTYTAAWFGVQQELPFVVWLPLCAVLGGLAGAVIGPFALRLRGNYLAIVTLGLLYVAQYVFVNWDSLTGGPSGTRTAAPVEILGLDFDDLQIGAESFTRRQGLVWLIWAVVFVVAILAKNIVRTRPGRAMQAVRDRDVAAEVIGVSLARYKISAFALASALAAVAGGLYGVVNRQVSPDAFGGVAGLLLSIQYVAMIIVGGLGTIGGSIVGAVVVSGLPQVITRISTNTDLPFVQGDAGGSSGILDVFVLNQFLFGFLIVAFLLFEPRGLAGVWLRIRRYFQGWPFSY